MLNNYKTVFNNFMNTKRNKWYSAYCSFLDSWNYFQCPAGTY